MPPNTIYYTTSLLCLLPYSYTTNPTLLSSLSFPTTALSLLLSLLYLILLCSLLTYVERKLLGSSHRRLGPSLTGWYGALQLVADGLKLLVKHTLATTYSITIYSVSSTVCLLLGTTLTLLSLAQHGHTHYSWVILTSLLVLGHVSTAGLSLGRGGNAWVDLGVQRALITVLALDVSLMVVLLLILGGVSEQGGRTSILALSLLSLLLVIDTGRVPVDLVEAESELVCGAWTSVGGIIYGLLAAAEYCMVVLGSIWIGMSLHLGVVSTYILTTLVWFTFLVVLRGLLPRVRIADLTDQCWTTLLPTSLALYTSVSITTTLSWYVSSVLLLCTSTTGLLQLLTLSVTCVWLLYSSSLSSYVLLLWSMSGVVTLVTLYSVLHSTQSVSSSSRLSGVLVLTLSGYGMVGSTSTWYTPMVVSSSSTLVMVVCLLVLVLSNLGGTMNSSSSSLSGGMTQSTGTTSTRSPW